MEEYMIKILKRQNYNTTSLNGLKEHRSGQNLLVESQRFERKCVFITMEISVFFTPRTNYPGVFPTRKTHS